MNGVEMYFNLVSKRINEYLDISSPLWSFVLHFSEIFFGMIGKQVYHRVAFILTFIPCFILVSSHTTSVKRSQLIKKPFYFSHFIHYQYVISQYSHSWSIFNFNILYYKDSNIHGSFLTILLGMTLSLC